LQKIGLGGQHKNEGSSHVGPILLLIRKCHLYQVSTSEIDI